MMWPPIGIIDIVSKPPATITSAPPLLMRSAAIAIDCKPDEQKRLIVIALVSTGKPARIAAARATFIPCSASGIAHPMITSSICEASSPGTRASASLITDAPISSGRVFLNVPFGALPTAVRTADTITASLIINSLMASLSSACAQFAPASYACPRASETLLVPNPTDTVQKPGSDDSDPRPSKSARAAYRSQNRDPKYNPHASSDEYRVSVSRAPALPKPEYLCVAAAVRNHSPRAPTLLSSHLRSDDLHSSRSNRLSSEKPKTSLLLLTLRPSRGRSFQTRASRMETDPRRQHLSESNPSCAATSPSCRHPQE